MADRIVTVFGGTGFLGRRVVRHLLGQNLSVRIASRHPDRFPRSSERPALQSIRADINDEGAVAAAVAGAYGVVNVVSLYLERGTETFRAVHVEAAERLARQAQQAGVERFVHVSGIGADITSGSLYISRRGEGELAVQAAFANAIIIRPAVMFGPDDAFLNTLVKLLKWLPAYPMFWRGLTWLQPVDVEDVAEAIARGLQPTARIERELQALKIPQRHPVDRVSRTLQRGCRPVDSVFEVRIHSERDICHRSRCHLLSPLSNRSALARRSSNSSGGTGTALDLSIRSTKPARSSAAVARSTSAIRFRVVRSACQSALKRDPDRHPKRTPLWNIELALREQAASERAFR
jgi:uncharacterized protein YbjT (DUF2867 family)